MPFCIVVFLSLALNVVSQTLQNLPETYEWAGFTSDSTGTYLTAAQYQVTEGAYNGAIYYSNNGGSTWSLSNAPAQGYYSIAGSSSGQILITIADSLFPYTSSDYGITWVEQAGPQAFSDVAISGNGQCMAYANFNTQISYSDNQGTSWTTVGPTARFQAVALDATGTYIVGAVQDIGLYFSSDSGNSFTLQYSSSSVSWTSPIAFSGGSTVYAGTGTSGLILVSTNYGSTWSATQGVYSKIDFLSVDSSGQNVLAIIGFGYGQIFFSTNGATTFTQLTSGDSSFCALNGNGNFILYDYNYPNYPPSYAYSADPNTLDLMPTLKPSSLPTVKPTKAPDSAPTTDDDSSDCNSSPCPTSCPPGYGGTYWTQSGSSCGVYCTDQPKNGQCASGGSGCTSSCTLLPGVIAGIVIGVVIVLVAIGYFLWRNYWIKTASPLSKQGDKNEGSVGINA